MSSQQLTVSSGRHARAYCPLRVAWPYLETPASLDFDGKVVPAQRDGSDLVFVSPALAPGLTVKGAVSSTETGEGVSLTDCPEGIAITIDSAPFTTYRYRNVPVRPYFWPVLGPDETRVTRSFPMERGLPGETQDHPHHRSIYFAHGEVNGADNWSEVAGHGFTTHKTLDEKVSGPVFGRFAATSEWQDSTHTPVLTEKARVTVWRGTPDLRVMDFELELAATHGDVFFGDTKEGGILSVRVASSLDVPRGGRIENAYGGIDEGETWGKPAHWCDYSGEVEGTKVGISVMDHPDSFRYPTCWHVRNYGLMTANPFGLKAFTNGAKDGSHLLERGQSLRFRYRLLIHRGDATAAGIRDHYLSFIAPPTVSLG
jgi:hypothetical protein